MEYQTVKTMKYSKETTERHPLFIKYKDKAINLLNLILKAEGVKKEYFSHEECLNLDEIEVLLKTNIGSRSATMDFCMGLTSKQLLLVEVKYKAQNPSNLRRKELEDKMKYSKQLLGISISIAKEKVFIFNDKVKGRAYNHLGRLFSNSPNIKVHTVEEFRDKYFE